MSVTYRPNKALGFFLSNISRTNNEMTVMVGTCVHVYRLWMANSQSMSWFNQGNLSSPNLTPFVSIFFWNTLFQSITTSFRLNWNIDFKWRHVIIYKTLNLISVVMKCWFWVTSSSYESIDSHQSNVIVQSAHSSLLCPFHMNNGRYQIISKNKIHVFFKLPEVFWHQQAAIHNAVFCVGEKKQLC